MITEKRNQINCIRMAKLHSCTTLQCCITDIRRLSQLQLRLCAVNKFMSFRHATITNSTSESCVLLLIAFRAESYFPCATKCNVQMQSRVSLYLLFTRARISHDFNCRVLKIYFRRAACAHKCSLLFSGTFKSWMENNSRQIEYTNPNDTDITWLTYLMLKCSDERRRRKPCNIHTNANSHLNINERRDFKITALDRKRSTM